MKLTFPLPVVGHGHVVRQLFAVVAKLGVEVLVVVGAVGEVYAERGKTGAAVEARERHFLNKIVFFHILTKP